MGKDFRNIANGKLDPKKIKWNHRADTVLRVENSVGQMINELYDRADKKSRLSQ